ncbi:MAG: DUF805 domain-containing protein [Alphaproteobacteria bacterium]
MDFFTSIKKCLKNYAQFHGRAGRSEFWWWFLFVVLALSVAGGLDNFFYTGGEKRDDRERLSFETWLDGNRTLDFSIHRERGGEIIVEYDDDSLSLRAEADTDEGRFDVRVDGDLSGAHPLGVLLLELFEDDLWGFGFSHGVFSDWDDDDGPFENLAFILLLLPGLAVGARRLHDTGRSGWWQLLILTVIGIVVLLFWWGSETREDEASGYGVAGEAGGDASGRSGASGASVVSSAVSSAFSSASSAFSKKSSTESKDAPVEVPVDSPVDSPVESSAESKDSKDSPVDSKES